LVAGLAAAPLPAPAAIAPEIVYQGYLVDSKGAVIRSPNVTMTLKFYPSEAATSPLYSCTTPSPMNLEASQGFVDVRLPVTLTGAQLNGEMWMEVTISDGTRTETLTPRRKVAPVLTALNADMLDGLDSTDLATLGGPQIFTGQKTFSGLTNFNSSISVNGDLQLSQTVNSPGPNKTFTGVNGVVTGTGVASISALQATVKATGAGGTQANPSAVRGAQTEASSDGYFTIGSSATAAYAGGNNSLAPSNLPIVMGLNAIAKFIDDSIPDTAVMDATAVYGIAQENQSGPNTGVRGLARGSLHRNIGVSGVANASDADIATVTAPLPAGFSAGLVGYNSVLGSNSFALYTHGDVRFTSGSLTAEGPAKLAAAGNEAGNGGNGPQLTILGAPTGPAAADPGDYELAVAGDARVAGDLRLGAGPGTVQLGADGANAYIRTPDPAGSLTIAPAGGVVAVQGQVRLSAAPSDPADAATKGYVDAMGGPEGRFVDRSESQDIGGRKTFVDAAVFAGPATHRGETAFEGPVSLTAGLTAASPAVKTSPSGEEGAAAGVRAVAAPDASRAIAVRGGAEATTPEPAEGRLVQGVVGSARSVAGPGALVEGGYFEAAVSGGQGGAHSVTGIGALASANGGTTGFTSDQVLPGGRFEVQSANAGAAVAVGVVGRVSNRGGGEVHGGSAAGVLGAARDSGYSNVGVLGFANASDDRVTTQTQFLAGTYGSAGVGVYAYNEKPGVALLADNGGGTGAALQTLGPSLMGGRVTGASRGNSFGDGANGPQLTVAGSPTGPDATADDYDFKVDGDAIVQGQLAAGTMTMGSTEAGGYLRPGGRLLVSGVVESEAGFRAPGTADFVYAEPRPRYVTIPAAAFRPQRSDYAFERPGASLQDRSPEGDPGGAGQQYYAEVQLPDGAVVTGLRLEAFDGDAEGSVVAELLRSSAGALGALGSAGPTADSGGQKVDGSISANAETATIDNANYGYLLRLTFSRHNLGSVAAQNVRVEYRVTRAGH